LKTLESGEHPDNAPQRMCRNPNFVIALNFPPYSRSSSQHSLSWRGVASVVLIESLVPGD
jgi:hypothetical protein